MANRRVRWLGLPLLMCLLGVQASADTALKSCRELRHAQPAEALQQCENALLGVAADPDLLFETLMHVAQLASQLGDPARAERALDQATGLLTQVADPLAAHRLARRRGLLAYHEGKSAQALARFLEALAASRAAADAAAIAVSENDLGVVYRHLGDYPAALEHFRASLQAKEALGEVDLGTSLANVGGLYLKLGDLPRAREYLQAALEAHQRNGRSLLQVQTLEELAQVDLGQGQVAAARSTLDQAWERYQQLEVPRDRLRLALQRAELELEAGDRVAAARWLEHAREQVRELQRRDPIRAELLAARLAQDAPARQRAYAALLAGVQDAQGEDPELLVQAHDVLADLAEALQQPRQALQHARDARRRSDQWLYSRHAQRLDALRVRFEVSQLQAERDRLSADSAAQLIELQRRRIQTYLALGLGVGALALLALYFQRRLYHQRLRTQRATDALERRIGQARQAARGLRSDLSSMHWLLDRQRIAALVFDASGCVRAVTADAAARLDATPEQLGSRPLAEVLGSELAQWAQQLVESSSLADPPGTDSSPRLLEGRAVQVQCLRLELEEELGVLLFEAAPLPASVAEPAVALGVQSAADTEQPGSSSAGGPSLFRQQLAELMQISLEAWERCTRKTRIDLAEASGIWRITIDDGRLRVRAMDRYLSVDTVPERPRWREVLRTAYYILAELELEPSLRQRIEQRVEQVLAATRKPA